jgi:serine protease AprX
VVNVSLGGPPYPGDGTDAFSLLVNAAVDAGAVVCVAAGNLGPAAGTIGSPAAASAAITVGASVSDPGTAGDEVAQFSSRGPTGDGRQKPDLLFPGVSIAAPRSAGTALGRPVDSLYTALDGTSQATPMASGSAALLLQANPRLSPDEIKSRMRRGARLLPGVPDTAQGAGRGDAYNTFVAAEGSPLEGGAGDGGGDGGGGGGDGGGGGGDGGGGGGEGRDGEPEGADPDPSPARGGCLAAIAAALRGR